MDMKERLLRGPEVLYKTGLSQSEKYRRIAAGTFPKPLKLGARAVAWRESEIQRWIEELIVESETCNE